MEAGKQLAIMDGDGHEEALAVFVNWGITKITRYIRKIFSVHTCQNIIVNEVREGLHPWMVERKPDAPAAIKVNHVHAGVRGWR
jgi:hypothetical protein